jgi:predicted ATPase
MSLTRVHISRFRCLYQARVALKPLTVLIGANDTGKSAFLAALRTVFTRGAGRTSIQREDYFRYVMEPQQRPEIVVWDPRQGSASQIEGDVGFFQLPSTGISMISQGSSDSSGVPYLGHDGSGVPNFLDYLVRRDRSRFDDIVAMLRKLIPGMESIEIDHPTPESRALELVVERGLKVGADRASTGLKMMLFFVALAFHPAPPDVILLEEPENGVHPQRLNAIVGLLRSITSGELGGHTAQIILSTHSPYLLDSVDLETDQVLVFQRQEDGTRTVEGADPNRLKKFLGEFQLGEVWYNEGERGLIASK